MKKRVVVISDLHCGHRVGLTPPRFQLDYSRGKWGVISAQLWESFDSFIGKHSPVDILFVNGDCIEGTGYRSGGTELVETDRIKQCDMAVECIKSIGASEIVMTYGTPYHTGTSEDFEDLIAERVGAKKIGGHEWVNVNGITFDIKHKIASTSVPYSKGTAISKARLQNYLWNEHDEQPKSDIIIRSHIHEFFACLSTSWLGIVTPALQGQGSKFGSRQCEGHVDFGIVWFNVEDDGRYTWGWETARVKSQKVKVLKL